MTTLKRFAIKTENGYYGAPRIGVDLGAAKTWRTRETPQEMLDKMKEHCDETCRTHPFLTAEVVEITVVKMEADEETELDQIKAKIQDLKEYLSSEKFHCGDEMDGYVSVQDVLNRI